MRYKDLPWEGLPYDQRPEWPPDSAVGDVVDWLDEADPITRPREVRLFSEQLADASAGKSFVLQGGDCAETFAQSQPEQAVALAGLLGEMSDLISARAGLPVVRVGRTAGQYAKPRSHQIEKTTGLPVWRGDLLNAQTPTAQARQHDPQRMALGHRYSTVMRQALSADVYCSHELLLLEYDWGLTRELSDGSLLDLSTHLPWIGDRTRNPAGAHAALAAAISNPIAIKVGPRADLDEIVSLCALINPEDRPGRLLLTPRLGARDVKERLPTLVRTVTQRFKSVIWQCDPMHGNARRLPSGLGTRHFDDVRTEVLTFIQVLRDLNATPAGVHLELTADQVTECVGGECGVTVEDVPTRFTSALDPRLNASQSVELAAAIGDELY